MHQALYRKWRPRSFDEVSGQEQVTSVLRYECETGRFSHAYLFCGSRGTGKTSCAKILAKAVNCEHPTSAGPCGVCAACRSIDSGAATDVLEMDAASNNGVDDIRDIRDEVIYTPSELKYRVYIIDEVHMLSASAFNALLKTLEEPPEHVIFILATTELQKLPATIVSRCQRFEFRRISTADLSARLMYIAGKEDITLDPEAARLIARQAQGGMRDAISLLELCAGSRLPITPALVTDTIGTMGREGMCRIVTAIADRDFDTLFAAVDGMVRSSKDLSVFWQELIAYYRDMLVVRTTRAAASYLDLTDAELSALQIIAARFTKETMLYHLSLMEDALFAMQRAFAIKRTVAEVTLTRMCDPALDTSPEAMLARLSHLEEQMVTGAVSFTARPAPPAPAAVQEPVIPAESPADQTFPAPGSPEAQAPAPRPEAPAPVPAAREETPADARRVLRPLRCYTEVVERVNEISKQYGSFLKRAKAFTTDGPEAERRIVIKFTSDFERDMSVKTDNGETLRRALSLSLKRNIAPEQLCVEIEPEEQDDGSSLDLILEALEDDTQ